MEAGQTLSVFHTRIINGSTGRGALLLDIPDSELKPGLIRLGYDYDRFSTNYAGTLLQLSGTIRWKGPFRSSVNVVIGASKPESFLGWPLC